MVESTSFSFSCCSWSASGRLLTPGEAEAGEDRTWWQNSSTRTEHPLTMSAQKGDKKHFISIKATPQLLNFLNQKWCTTYEPLLFIITPIIWKRFEWIKPKKASKSWWLYGSMMRSCKMSIFLYWLPCWLWCSDQLPSSFYCPDGR